MDNQANLEHIIAFCERKGYIFFKNPGELNILYVEGMNPDHSLNPDRLDGWNDLRLVIDFQSGRPRLLFLQVATTEPGRAATLSDAAKKRGGVARITFGQHLECWQIGKHKGTPALVQVGNILVHRDKNRDGIRTRDPIAAATGINQHGTSLAFKGKNVGTWSEGCLVGLIYIEHLRFIALLKTDPRYIADPKFKYSSIILPGDALMVRRGE